MVFGFFGFDGDAICAVPSIEVLAESLDDDLFGCILDGLSGEKGISPGESMMNMPGVLRLGA